MVLSPASSSDQATSLSRSAWAGTNSEIAEYIVEATRRCLAAYRENPLLILEHANIERATAEGGYGRRQIYELVQNAADALMGAPGGRAQIVLTTGALYAANEGNPVTTKGIDAILSSHISGKRGAEIGRFGLGFKSVLGVTESPQIYSRTGSLGFNASEAAQRIRAIVPSAQRCPILRVAEPLDTEQAAAHDSVLAELMSWAITVVKLPFEKSVPNWLEEDIKSFPAQFLLFCPHIGRLTLENRIGDQRREIMVSAGDDVIRLLDDGADSTWKVFSTVHTPSRAAQADAGELADRDELPVVWAVPLAGRAQRGRFWAFAPTEFYTTLSGVLNAPWKTNEDRQTMLNGTFNQELVDAAARLVALHLPDLTEGEEPGAFLDLLPGRGREAPNWADGLLTERVYYYAARTRSLPNQLGKLSYPSGLHLHPAGLPRAALDIWAAHPERPEDWCHPSVETRERRPRVEMIMKPHGRPPASIGEWLQALVPGPSLAGSIAALRIAGSVLQSNREAVSEIQGAKILLTSKGVLTEPRPGTVFVPAEESVVTDALLVHPALMADASAAAAVRALGIKEVDPSSELEALLRKVPFESMKEEDWHRFWRFVRRVPTARAVELIRPAAKFGKGVKARTVHGRFRHLHEVLMPGPIVPGDGSRDTNVTIDIRYHAAEQQVLTELGAKRIPEAGGSGINENWYAEYREMSVAALVRLLKLEQKQPRESSLQFDKQLTAGPLDPLDELSLDGRVEMTQYLLLAGKAEESWLLSVNGAKAGEQPVRLEPPYLWKVKNKGAFRTPFGVRAPRDCVGPGLRDFAAVLPVAQQCSEEDARKLKLAKTLGELTQKQWRAALEAAQQLKDDWFVGRFYGEACRVTAAPELIRCRVREGVTLAAPGAVTAVVDEDEARVLRELGIAFCRASLAEDAVELCERWGLRPASETVSKETIVTESGSGTPVGDRFPGLAVRLPYEQNDIELIPCSALRVEMVTKNGTTGQDRTVLERGGRIYYADRLTDGELLEALVKLLGITLSAAERQSILEQRKAAENRERLRAVRNQATAAGKLLNAVGPEALRRRLPPALTAREGTQGSGGDIRLAEMALAVYGVETLQTFREELVLAGFAPPAKWAGSAAARNFVQDLGFPREYAGFDTPPLQSSLEVEGPPDLAPLHSFQSEILARVRALPSRSEGLRGLLSLPTGAGKTRVMVEALVTAMKEDRLRGPILWIAQSEELCEQAVQTWSYIWRARGPLSRLHIDRLWGSNEAGEWKTGTQVVVATIQKLQGCIKDSRYKWLSNPTWLIIDEAHMSTEPSYTAVLEWLSMGRGTDRLPFVGLTATPFRGGEEETLRLVRRYGSYRLDEGVLGEDPYGELQKMGVLAQVDHQLLKGTTVDLNEKELEELEQLKRVPASVEERVGRDQGRNQTLIDSIKGLNPDWPVLLFATSVEHAKTMAALLSVDGISAAAVSGLTDKGARRHYIEEFRSGGLRVLCNFSVLAAGFDAPAVRAVYVARPTYSALMYQQMIGRGLRGPLNGGKERCLIVNVEDNLLRFGERPAFRDFEYLWHRE